MTREAFGTAYENGHQRTIHFLLSKGLPEDLAMETAQAAWARGWERRHQIRDVDKTLTWVNSIALNLYRSQLRREPARQELEEFPVPPTPNLAAIDVDRVLRRCAPRERRLLENYYLRENDIADIAREQHCSQTAVRVRLVRARKRVRRWLARALVQPWHCEIHFVGS